MFSTPLRASTVRRYYDSYYPRNIELVEDLLRAISLVLPVISVLNLFLHYHTHLLARHRVDKSDLFVFNKHVETYYLSEWPSKAASRVLSVVSYTEVVFEMLLARRVQNKAKRWQWIAGLETLKQVYEQQFRAAILRLILLCRSGRRTVVHPTHLVRNTDPATLEISQTEKHELATLDPRSGLPSTGLLGRYTMKPRRGLALLGEIMWITRPVIYSLLILHRVRYKPKPETDDGQDEDKEKDAENHWQPWLVSALIDVAARVVRSTQAASALEHEEFTRRDYLLLYYLLRGPVYTLCTKRLLDMFCDATEHRPLVSIIGTALNDYRPFWEQSYFYTSGS
ncbi:peroxisome membrane protein [Dichotomocladium elegans]|nr:peroxisome membrane protein [Dichotomocladium elegans]